MKPMALASGHGRYITVTPERTLVSVGEWPLHVTCYDRYKFFNRFTYETVTVRNGRFTSETAVRWFQKLNRRLVPELV
jgi:hypothetical protein